jgi:hypothetical protein
MLRMMSRCTCVVGLLCALYFGWAWYRVATWAISAQRAWPYPDRSLIRLHDWLDEKNPPPPGSLKIHGEWDKVCLILGAGVALSLAVSAGSALPLARRWQKK